MLIYIIRIVASGELHGPYLFLETALRDYRAFAMKGEVILEECRV